VRTPRSDFDARVGTSAPGHDSVARTVAVRCPAATLLRASVFVLVLGVPSLAAPRVSRPPVVEIDGCVMPAPACGSVRDVIRLRAGDRKLELAVERLSVPMSTTSSSKVLDELKLRGVSAHGPSELTARLVAGAHLRIRGVLRSGPYLLLQSVEPRPEK
jgi:hypothetical protein